MSFSPSSLDGIADMPFVMDAGFTPADPAFVGSRNVKSIASTQTFTSPFRMNSSAAGSTLCSNSSVKTAKALTDKACKISLDLSFDYAGPLVRATLGPLFNQAANTLVDAFCQRAKQIHG